MSVAGLIVGAVVAFFIPRYYVAKTTITYKGGALDPRSRTAADPLFAKVTNARLSLHHTLETTLEKLNLIGSNPDDPERQGIIARYDGRIEVNEYSFEDRGYKNIELLVRDQDGERSALLANQLRRDWINSLLHELELEAGQAANHANQTVAELYLAHHDLLQSIEQVQGKYDIQPDIPGSTWAIEEKRGLLDRVRELENARDDIKAEIEVARRNLEFKREEISITSPTRPKSQVVRELTPEQRAVLQGLEDKLLYYTSQALDSRIAATRELALARVASYQAQIDAIRSGVGPAGSDGAEDVPNPEYATLLKERQAIENELSRLNTQLRLKLEQLDAQERRRADLQEAFVIYGKLLAEKATSDQKIAAATEESIAQTNRFEISKRGSPFEQVDAAVPPTPTEPGFLLVAFAGSIVGLGAAIGFVLLADFLRSTFKTVDDVGYALAVPVLGVMAHLETADQRASTVRHRRRLTLVAASFVVLNLSLVTVYYVKRTSLPVWVVQALDRVLGPEAPAAGTAPR